MAHQLTYTVFTDFDGTIAVNDIGDLIFEQFSNVNVCYDAFASYQRGEITARECWRRGFQSMKPVTKKEFTDFILTQPVDEGFKVFVEYCETQSIPVTVLSDGFDAYIDPFLKQHRLERIPRYSNKLLFNADKSIVPVFPHTDSECTRCANCKRNHLMTLSGDDQVIVYIGDGISDRCPAQYADVVFAKDSLVSFCERHNITFHRFNSFADILKTFRTMIETSKPKKRRTAELARKEIFTME